MVEASLVFANHGEKLNAVRHEPDSECEYIDAIATTYVGQLNLSVFLHYLLVRDSWTDNMPDWLKDGEGVCAATYCYPELDEFGEIMHETCGSMTVDEISWELETGNITEILWEEDVPSLYEFEVYCSEELGLDIT